MEVKADHMALMVLGLAAGIMISFFLEPYWKGVLAGSPVASPPAPAA